MRDDICDALESIPESIDNVQKLGDLYPDTGFLQWRASAMCIAVLDLLEHIIQWYTSSRIRKALKAVVQGDAYGKELESRLKSMTRLRQAVEQQATSRVETIKPSYSGKCVNVSRGPAKERRLPARYDYYFLVLTMLHGSDASQAERSSADSWRKQGRENNIEMHSCTVGRTSWRAEIRN
jgi:hypothetical protein